MEGLDEAMKSGNPSKGHLTDYERAVCYYTLPRVSSPLSLGLIVVYAVCLLEAVGALLIGLVLDSGPWRNAGMWALCGIVLFGVVVFSVRALLNDVRRRRALSSARGVPDADEAAESFPDPFSGHVLYHYSVREPGAVFSAENDETPVYVVERAGDAVWWRICAVGEEGEEACRVKALRGARSFTLNTRAPRLLAVYVQEREMARISRGIGLAGERLDIYCEAPLPRHYIVRGGGVFVEEEVDGGGGAKERLAGRIYELHGRLHLDIEAAYFTPPILAHFVTLY